jgi:hypothetical protein
VVVTFFFFELHVLVEFKGVMFLDGVQQVEGLECVAVTGAGGTAAVKWQTLWR